MLAEQVRRDDPRHLRQRTGAHVALERGHQVFATRGLGVVGGGTRHDGAAAAVQRRRAVQLAKVGEVWMAVVAVVIELLIDLPTDASLLQALGVGAPGVAGKARIVARHVRGPVAVVAVVHRLIAVVADAQAAGAGEHVHAIGIGRAEQRGVVAVAKGEGIGQRVVERQVLALKVAHAHCALLRDPGIVVLPGLVRALPVVVEILHPLRAAGLAVEPERQYIAVAALALGLVPDRLAAGQPQRPRIAIAAHPAQAAEVMIEGAVLLHQDHHMLHVLQRAGDPRRRHRQRTADDARQQRHGRASPEDHGRAGEKTTTAVIDHEKQHRQRANAQASARLALVDEAGLTGRQRLPSCW
ncbi:hypothetical protein NB706_000980 [Xanthomonas sacchari]|nr:hypothetical protein [Xanthomonas sacchari]